MPPIHRLQGDRRHGRRAARRDRQDPAPACPRRRRAGRPDPRTPRTQLLAPRRVAWSSGISRAPGFKSCSRLGKQRREHDLDRACLMATRRGRSAQRVRPNRPEPADRRVERVGFGKPPWWPCSSRATRWAHHSRVIAVGPHRPVDASGSQRRRSALDQNPRSWDRASVHGPPERCADHEQYHAGTQKWAYQGAAALQRRGGIPAWGSRALVAGSVGHVRQVIGSQLGPTLLLLGLGGLQRRTLAFGRLKFSIPAVPDKSEDRGHGCDNAADYSDYRCNGRSLDSRHRISLTDLSLGICGSAQVEAAGRHRQVAARKEA